MRIPITLRFWSKVRKTDGCWYWTGAISNTGYGNFWINEPMPKGRFVTAHRMAWLLTRGPLPEDGRDPQIAGVVMHHCDTCACVRPDHLFLGTFQDNSRDMVSKGRNVAAPQRVTDDEVVQIRKRYADGETQATLARIYGICQTQIGRIIRRVRRQRVA